MLTLKAPFAKTVAFVTSVDKDQAAQNILPDLRSTLSDMLKHNSKRKLGICRFPCLIAG